MTALIQIRTLAETKWRNATLGWDVGVDRVGISRGGVVVPSASLLCWRFCEDGLGQQERDEFAGAADRGGYGLPEGRT